MRISRFVSGAALLSIGFALPLHAADRIVSLSPEHVSREWTMSDSSAWKSVHDAMGDAIELFKQSDYKPDVRSPLNIALLRDSWVGDFTLNLEALQTSKEYGHRDLCLFFGFQNPTQFYYVHMATAADDHAHNIFLVDHAPRRAIAGTTTKGIDWGTNAWHHIRLERSLGEGAIRVYFDDLAKPIMTAQDKTFGEGAIGVGSFDDTGKFRAIHLHAPRISKTHIEFPKPPISKQP